MIKIFEQFIDSDLIGREAVLIKRGSCYYDENLRIRKFNGNNLGWKFTIVSVIKYNNKTLISYVKYGIYYDLKDFKISDPPKRIFSDIDPYGEEDWNVESLNTDTDPYGEEDWNDDNIQEGDIVEIVDKEKSIWKTHRFWDAEIQNGTRGKALYKFTEPIDGQNLIYVDFGDGSGWYNTSKIKRVNEQHSDIDPYGEEDWDELSNIPFEPEDEVICIGEDFYFGLIRGEKYIIKKIYNGHHFLNQHNFYVDVEHKNGNITKGHKLSRFKKLIKEQINIDIDPYGEEDWRKEKKYVRCKNDVFTSNGLFWIFHSNKEYEIEYEDDKIITLKTKIQGHGTKYSFSKREFKHFFNRIK